MYVMVFKVNGKIDSVDATSESKEQLMQFAADQYNNGKPYKWRNNIAAAGGIEDGEYEITIVDHVLVPAPLDPTQVFTPELAEMTRADIAVSLKIHVADSRLTDEFCQKFINAYHREQCDNMDGDEFHEWLVEEGYVEED